ncbi:MAG: serine/threonine protein kinase [Myxococcaceae bacterium]|nr:serine/threonine protein kinase [Myxococcaceae bacterium]
MTTELRATDYAVGAILGETAVFEILGKLGVGGMADVFLANAEIGGRVQAVALKRIRASMSDCADVWPMFQREAEVCKLLNHPAIVQLKAVGDDAQGPYLALEYVAGATVAELIRACSKKGELVPLEHALTMCRDVAAGIAYAHGLVHDFGQGLVHRDITPENVLVGYDGYAKVTDFGIARLVTHTRFTRTGAVRGKVGYLAPELVEGGEPSPASDVFALAATLFRVLTGKAAFKGNNDGELLRSLMFGAPPSLKAARSAVPAELADWSDRAFHKDPAKRPTAAELVKLIPERTDADRQQLGRWLATVFPPRVFTGGTGTGTGTREKPPEDHDTALFDTLGRKRVLALSLAAALTFVLGAALFYFWPRAPAPTVEPEPVAAVEPVVDEPVTPEELETLTGDEADEVEAPKPEAPHKAAAPHRVPRRGLLEVRVSPYADVFVDGKLIGTTPLKPIVLSPGTHKVMLVNAELDAHKTVTVTVDAGKKTRVTERFGRKK